MSFPRFADVEAAAFDGSGGVHVDLHDRDPPILRHVTRDSLDADDLVISWRNAGRRRCRSEPARPGG